jgi:hypothetical protein
MTRKHKNIICNKKGYKEIEQKLGIQIKDGTSWVFTQKKDQTSLEFRKKEDLKQFRSFWFWEILGSISPLLL